jgi:hypothetical protein
MITEFYIDDYLIHSIANQPYMWLDMDDGIEGLGDAPIRSSEYDNPGEDGGFVDNQLYGMRPITLTGQIGAPSFEIYETVRRAVHHACRIRRDSYGMPQPVRLRFRTMNDQEYYIDAYPRTPRIRDNNIRHSPFILQFVASDAVIYEIAQQNSLSITRAMGGGLLLPFKLPFRLGASSGGSLIVDNDGTAEVWPIITLTGEMHNPVVRHDEKDIKVQLNYTLTASDEVVIDMKNKRITLNGTSSLIAYMTIDSDWFKLDIGSNRIRFSTSTGSDPGTMRVSWYNGIIAL